LTVVNLLSITDIAAHFETVPGLQAFIVSDAVLGVAVAVFGVWVGIRLVRVTPDAVRLATVYLAAYFGYVLFESVAPFGFGLPDAWSTELAKEVPKNLGRAGIYVGIWASYFKKSKRVAQTFGSQRGA
jgi:hypothetical protein